MRHFVRKWLNSKYVLISIVMLAFALRLITVNQSLWLDESIGAYAVKNFTYQGILKDFLRSDNHPPLYYLLLKLWTRFFGYSELSIRFPTIFFGVGTVWLTYLVARVLVKEKNKAVPIISSLFVATSQFHIYYSQEARMYSMAAFLASLAMYAFLKMFASNDHARFVTWYGFLFSLSVTCLVFTDYVPVFLIPVFWIHSLLQKKDKKWWINYLLSYVPLLILGIFWMPAFLIQSGKGKWLLSTLPEWKSLAGGATFKQLALVWMKFTLGRISLPNKLLYYLLVATSSIPFLIALSKQFKESREGKLIWMWLVIPLTLGFIASFIAPFFIYFRFTYVIPAFYLLVAFGISRFKSKKVQKLLVSGVLLVNLVGCSIYFLDTNQQREKWREATAFVDAKVAGREVVIFEYPQSFTPYRWYAKGGVQAVGVCDSITCNPDKTSYKTKKTIEGKTGVYYFEYLQDLTDPEGTVVSALISEGFEVAEVYNFSGVGQVFYYQK